MGIKGMWGGSPITIAGGTSSSVGGEDKIYYRAPKPVEVERLGPEAQNCTCKPQGKHGYSRWRQREWCELEDASCVGWHKNYCTECVETEKGSQKCTHCKGIFWDWRQRSFASSAKEWIVILLVLTLAYSAYAQYQCTAAEEGEASKAGFKAWFQQFSQQVEDALNPFIRDYWTAIKLRAAEVGKTTTDVLEAGQQTAYSFGESPQNTLRDLLKSYTARFCTRLGEL